jgi:ribosomal protein S18 acetylase RimI-like enzyme
MDTPEVRLAAPGDAALLLEMMTEFYAETRFSLDRDRAAEAFERLLEDERLGRAWILSQDGAPAGYVVLTLGFSMEFHGRDGFVDDLFIRPEFRGIGLGRAAMVAVREACSSLGVRAVHLEVDPENRAATGLYRKFGFAMRPLRLMTLRLD